MENPLETGDIAAELEKIGRCSGVLTPRAIDACNQGALLLRRLRPVILSLRPAEDIIEELKDMLAKQGDG